MEHLSLLEKEVLEILKQLEYLCESIELNNPEKIAKEKSLSIKYKDLNLGILNKRMNIHNVEKYLQSNEVPFNLTENFEFDDLSVLESSNDPIAVHAQIAEIYGENIEEIKLKIKGLIDKLSSKELEKHTINITYNKGLGKLTFNNKNEVILEGQQRDVTSCLTEKNAWKEDIGIGDLHDYIKKENLEYDKFSPTEKKQRNDSVRSSSNEINKKTSEFLEKNKVLIKYKDNRFWLEYEIQMNKDE